MNKTEKKEPTLPQRYIYLVEDDDSIRNNLTMSLEYLGFIVHPFADARDFLESDMKFSPAVLISDVRMPGMSGVELQTELIKRGQKFPIIFISGESTMPQTIQAMKQGAIEFLLKPFLWPDLMDAVSRGIAKELETIRLEKKISQLQQKLTKLSSRELDTFKLLAKGYANTELMSALSIALPTVKQYKSAVMRKLRLNTLAELIDMGKVLNIN